VEAGGEEQWCQRHLEYFYQLAEEAEKALVGPDQVAWMNRLEGESDNLRAALNWARQNDVEVGLQLSTALWRFWVDRGYIREQQKQLSQLLSA
jgi:predicted ATPase